MPIFTTKKCGLVNAEPRWNDKKFIKRCSTGYSKKGICAIKSKRTSNKASKNKCNYEKHCLNTCELSSWYKTNKNINKYWCYVNEKSFTDCDNKKIRNKEGSKWSYEPCNNFIANKTSKNPSKKTK